MQNSVAVTPERLERWLGSFAERHRGVSYTATSEVVRVQATDPEAVLECEVPFPPMPVRDDLPFGGLLEHARRDRLVGVLLVRRGGYAVGVFDGRRLVASKVGSRHVQGRTAAGGWSQQRFARRRERQARELYQAAADVAATLLLPYVGRLDAVVLGGDRRGSQAVLEDKRLSALQPLLAPRHLDVADPKLKVLQSTPDRFRAVVIRIRDAGVGDNGGGRNDGRRGDAG
ncbi:MAG TPA: acVLRF1 family peptidyl-tRNA hydrolase [Actinopolymorphaceae bacterium]